MEASVIRESDSGAASLLRDPRAAFLRLQSDERLVALTRRGNEAAYETLIARYRARLLAFCRHMVGSTEDAEDILQEVFVAAYRAMLADERELNVRPWLYRIARNRSLNHLRRPRPTGVDSMDIFEGGVAAGTADRVHDKLDLEDLVKDVKRLPETQRTALLLREMGGLPYEQIAEAMDTSVPSVKSLLVRARVSLAEAAESRRLSCDEVRLELGAAAEGLQKLSAPARRHVNDCDRCRAFKKDLNMTNRKLAVLAPVGGLFAVKNLLALKLFGGGAAAGGTGGIGAATGAGTAGAAAAGGAAGAGIGASVSAGLSTGLGAIAAKVGAGLATAALVTGGVAEVAKRDIQPVAPVDRPAISKPLDAAVTPDPGDGGVAPGPVESDDSAKSDDSPEEPDKPKPTDKTSAGDTNSDGTGPTAPAGAPPPAPEVVDEESSTVEVAPGRPDTSRPDTGPTGGPTAEGPGMPAPAPPSAEPTPPVPTPPPPTGATGAGGATGVTSATP